MVDFKFTQLPNKALQELRRDIKEEAHENVGQRVNVAAKQFAARVSSKPVDSMSSEPGAAQADTSSAALDPKALKWADRAVRPYQLGMSYGTNAAHLWDRAFSYVVGRGIKESKNETAFDPSKFWSDGQVRHLALRQEGILGMAVRLPAAALGAAVGKLFKNEANAAKAKQIINEGATTFNGVARLATLGITSGICATLGILAGIGISAVSATVAVIAIRNLEKQQAAASAKPTEENETSFATAQGSIAGSPKSDGTGSFETVSTTASRAENLSRTQSTASTHAASEAQSAENQHRLSGLQGRAMKELRSLQHPHGKILDRLQEELPQLKQKRDDALASGDKQSIIAADEALARCQNDLQAYGTADRTHKSLVDKHASADKAMLDAIAVVQNPETRNTQSVRDLREARINLKAAEAELTAHEARFAKPAQDPADLNEAVAHVLSYQDEAFAMAQALGHAHVEGRSLPMNANAAKQAAEGYQALSTQWTRLHKRGLVPDQAMPLDAHIAAHVDAQKATLESLPLQMDASLQNAWDAHDTRRANIKAAHENVETHQNQAIAHLQDAGAHGYGTPEREAFIKQAVASLQEELAGKTRVASAEAEPTPISASVLEGLEQQLGSLENAAGVLLGAASMLQQTTPTAVAEAVEKRNTFANEIAELRKLAETPNKPRPTAA